MYPPNPILATPSLLPRILPPLSHIHILFWKIIFKPHHPWCHKYHPCFCQINFQGKTRFHWRWSRYPLQLLYHCNGYLPFRYPSFHNNYNCMLVFRCIPNLHPPENHFFHPRINLTNDFHQHLVQRIRWQHLIIIIRRPNNPQLSPSFPVN